MAEQIRFNWAHFMVLGMLARRRKPIVEREFTDLNAPRMTGALLDLQEIGLTKPGEYPVGNTPGSAPQQYWKLTDRGRQYVREVMKYASGKMTLMRCTIEEGLT